MKQTNRLNHRVTGISGQPSGNVGLTRHEQLIVTGLVFRGKSSTTVELTSFGENFGGQEDRAEQKPKRPAHHPSCRQTSSITYFC